jgi:signal transduction histidine kinase
MRMWFGNRGVALLGILGVALLLIGGLGWVTRAALDLDALQRQQRHEAEEASRLRVALWKLDRIASVLAREDSRPFHHYSAIFAPSAALNGRGTACAPGSVIEPSPLLGADLPDWMLLHFQISDANWESPQVPSKDLEHRLREGRLGVSLANITKEREQILLRLNRSVPPRIVLDQARKFVAAPTLRDNVILQARNAVEQGQANSSPSQPVGQGYQNTVDFLNRSQAEQRLSGRAMNPQTNTYNYVGPGVNEKVAELNLKDNGRNWLTNNDVLSLDHLEPVEMSPLQGLWLPARHDNEELVLLRLVRIGKQEYCQGIVLDADRLRRILLEEVNDIFPGAHLVAVHPDDVSPPELTMSALPFRLDPGSQPLVVDISSWTPLSVGLALAWIAAGVALAAVCLGGWSLVALSERRIRFVSAVTHELRTPLTTLRLYLDMLSSGMVRDEEKRADYLRTLHGEAERLHRLVVNVLDFSRLENNRPRVTLTPVAISDLLEGLRTTWDVHCKGSGKSLVIENTLPFGATLLADGELLQQVLGNLIDNACKYTREASDNRLWVRARSEGADVVLEVEDRGPGVPRAERRGIFHAFRRGAASDVIAGGVGLGLALAQRWSRLLGASLSLETPAPGGACFRVRFPRAAISPGERGVNALSSFNRGW